MLSYDSRKTSSRMEEGVVERYSRESMHCSQRRHWLTIRRPCESAVDCVFSLHVAISLVDWKTKPIVSRWSRLERFFFSLINLPEYDSLVDLCVWRDVRAHRHLDSEYVQILGERERKRCLSSRMKS